MLGNHLAFIRCPCTIQGWANTELIKEKSRRLKGGFAYGSFIYLRRILFNGWEEKLIGEATVVGSQFPSNALAFAAKKNPFYLWTRAIVL